jgi:hypothetical protein
VSGCRASSDRRLRALNDATRTLIEQVRTLDAPDDVVERALHALNDVHVALAPHTHPGPYQQAQLRAPEDPRGMQLQGEPAEFFPYSPIIGGLNPISPPVHMWFDGSEMHGSVTLGAPYNGPPSLVHGGVIALIFDELLGALLVKHQRGGFTGTLSIRYERPTPLAEPLEMRAWLDRSDGRKSYALGELLHDGHVTARAEGIFISSPTGPGDAAAGAGT